MNHAQITKMENTLLAALSFLQQHPPQKITPDAELEYDHLVAELRTCLALIRTWRALARSLGQGQEKTESELPGQLHIPGVDPCFPKK